MFLPTNTLTDGHTFSKHSIKILKQQLNRNEMISNLYMMGKILESIFLYNSGQQRVAPFIRYTPSWLCSLVSFVLTISIETKENENESNRFILVKKRGTNELVSIYIVTYLYENGNSHYCCSKDKQFQRILYGDSIYLIEILKIESFIASLVIFSWIKFI